MTAPVAGIFRVRVGCSSRSRSKSNEKNNDTDPKRNIETAAPMLRPNPDSGFALEEESDSHVVPGVAVSASLDKDESIRSHANEAAKIVMLIAPVPAELIRPKPNVKREGELKLRGNVSDATRLLEKVTCSTGLAVIPEPTLHPISLSDTHLVAATVFFAAEII